MIHPDSDRVKHREKAPITTLDATMSATSFGGPRTPEAQVARALMGLSMFHDWEHQPTPSELGPILLQLDEQELMTAAAVCLLRLAKLRDGDASGKADAA